MSLASKYNPRDHEDKWYAYWQEHGMFRSEPDEREPYTIVIPPPNVTGVLHMGHMLNNTIQDILIRRARMKGYNACWVPGTDHASIATEAKVVNKLKEEGISKYDIGREEFLNHAWDWTHKHGGIILEQLKKLGASCDWDRTKFTMDQDLSESVLQVFVDLYNKGLIYRGVRMINWDPSAKTALSDEEVVHKEVAGKLYHLKYAIEGSSEFITIATTRPETILGDTAICVHPEDERYAHLHGKKALVPLVGRAIPILADDYVDREFGTGALKITPAHDVNDYEIGLRHNLESIDVLNDDGSINDSIGLYAGLDRFACRKQIVKDLKEGELLVKEEEHVHKVGFSERTDAVIEPKLSLQWFCKMEDMAGPALENVMNDTIKFFPKKFKNTYRHWMENVKDWCVSRQLWWGHRIPAWYFGPGPNDFVVSLEKEDALKLAQEKAGNSDLKLEDLRQDEDCLDTWFSSWLWPLSVFDGIRNPENEEVKYYYPTNDLVTAPEILFFWVARMIMAGYEYKDELPFKNVYLTGIVRDKQGRKMSKSLGNSPDPIELMNTYGADGVRVGMLFSSPAGNDLPFDEALCEQGRNFANKIWNAFRLMDGWEVVKEAPSDADRTAMVWMESKFNKALEEINQNFGSYRISDALMGVYKLIWDDFCSWYLEMVKPEYGSPISEEVKNRSLEIFERLLKVLHPFMPFLTETLWQNLENRSGGESIMISDWPVVGKADAKKIQGFETFSGLVSEIRKARAQKQISPKEALDIYLSEIPEELNEFMALTKKLANLDSVVEGENDGAGVSFRFKNIVAFIPLEGTVDLEEEKRKMEEELAYTQGFLNKIEKKLSNEKFVNGAPEKVVNMERKKKADAEAKIETLKSQLLNLS